MRSKAPALLPILRSRLQGELLAWLFADPSREWTISQLAASSGAPLTSVQSEIDRLAEGDLVVSRKVGRSRLIRVNNSNPVIEPLGRVVALTFGPAAVVAECFGSLGAERVLIFGSWAARFAGEAGQAPGDVDVLVVGDDVSRQAMYQAAECAESRLGIPVNPVLRSARAWVESNRDPLLSEILVRPYTVIADLETDSQEPG